MSSIMKGLVDEQDIEETKKLSAQEKFKRSMARAGYDMDAGAKRLQDLLDKQKKEREEFEKKEKEIKEGPAVDAYMAGKSPAVAHFADQLDKIKEDETLQYAAEITPKVSPYAGVKDRKFRGAIGEAVKQVVENPNESPTDAGYQEGGWRKMNEEELDEDLRKWFKEKWVRFGPDGKIRGACARGSSSEGKPKCLPQSKAHSLGKKGRASAAARKRREDPDPERRGPAKNVATKKKSNEGVQENMQANYKNYSTQDLLRMIKTIKRDEIGMKIIKAISNELIRRKEGVVEAGMPASVIKSKQRYSKMTPAEFAQAHGTKSDDELKAMAWRHGYGKGSTHYVDKRNKGKQGVAEGVYTVAPGDNLSTLARKYGTTVDALLKMNPNIKNANLMQAGAKLNVPDVANTPQGAVTTGSNTSIQPNTRNKASNFVKGLPSSDKEISSVLKSGPGFIEVKTVDGEAQRRKGDANWRMNNPGNLRVSSWTKQQPGYVGVGDAGPNGKFAVFATLDDGRQAKKNLLFGAQSPYINLSIKDAITKYAPPSENRTDTYINQVVQGIKASPDTTLNKLSQQQQNAMLDIITKLEGFKIGSIEKIPTVAEGYSDMSGLMSASNLNNSYIITAELAEGGKKKFRVKAQNERVAIEKFKKHHSMANIISVKEEGVSEGSKYPRNPASYHLKKYPVPQDQMAKPVKKEPKKPEQKPEEKVDEGKRIPRKPGQPANSKNHSDLYTDENPKGTIHGLKFATAEDARSSVSKIRNSGRSHAHKIQAAVAMEQRAKAAGKAEAASVYRKFINSMKKKTDESQIDEACWKGYHKEGMKTMFGKKYPNCVKNKKKTNEDYQECPECGGAMYEVSLMNEKKDACYYKVKSRYKVWPSAYASGALVKCRKKGAKNWGTKTEGQIYSTGGGAGEAQRWYTPKDNLGETSNILKGILRVNE